MSQARFRQVARLEKLAQPYIQRRRQGQAPVMAVLRKEAFEIMASLGLLTLYGDPKIDEPLSNAWQRCVESKAWKEGLEKDPDFGKDLQSTPFNYGVGYIASYFRKYFLPELPGANETDKLNAIFD